MFFLAELLNNRVWNIDRWLEKNGKNCKQIQKHTKPDTDEKIYWHYGYMMALKDVIRLINKSALSEN